MFELVHSIEVKDISLADYIQIRHAVYLPHTAGRYSKKQFKKAQMPIVERLVDRCVYTCVFTLCASKDKTILIKCHLYFLLLLI